MGKAAEEFARAANGHVWTKSLMLQAACKDCGHMAVIEHARDGRIPACRGRVALKAFLGHWLDAEDRCRLCGLHLPNGYSWLDRKEHPRFTCDTGDTALRVFPACTKCDHAGALTDVAPGDATWTRIIPTAEGSPRTKVSHCAACDALVVKKADEGSISGYG